MGRAGPPRRPIARRRAVERDRLGLLMAALGRAFAAAIAAARTLALAGLATVAALAAPTTGSALAALALAPPAAAAGPSGPGVLYGIVPQGSGELSETDLDRMQAGSVDAVRVLAHWGVVEHVPGSYDWTRLDRTIGGLAQRGIEPFLFLYGSPEWAAQRDGFACQIGGEPECATFLPRARATRSAFAAFAGAAARRYGPGGEFWTAPDRDPGFGEATAEPPCGCDQAVPVTRWQIWNEPNAPKYAAPDANPRRYARLLSAASRQIRGADPAAEIIAGGIWGPQPKPGPSPRLRRPLLAPIDRFLRRLYRVPGIKRRFDAIAVHPYSSNVDGVLRQIRAARAAVRGAGDDAATYVTEIGWASRGPRNKPYVKGPLGQARILDRALTALERQRRAFRLRGVFWYTWRDGGSGAAICRWCAGAGLRTASGRAKPAWRKFVKFSRR